MWLDMTSRSWTDHIVPLQEEFGRTGLLETLTLNNVPTEYAATRLRTVGESSQDGQYTHSSGTLTRENRAGVVSFIPVEVKSLPKGTSRRDRILLLLEAQIMAQFEHTNIVSLLGVVTLGAVHVLSEQCEPGTLAAFVASEKCSVALHIALCLDVARGVNYLSTAGYAHPALCAANIRLAVQRVAKISGFCHQQEFAADPE